MRMIQTFITVAVLAALVVMTTTQQCSYDVTENHIIDVNGAEKLGAVFMNGIDSLTREGCQSACCGLEAILDDNSTVRCNLAVFLDSQLSSTRKNCFLVFCPSELTCVLRSTNKFSSTFVARAPVPETTEPGVLNPKPTKPKFYHPDAPYISFHKLFRRSLTNGNGVAKQSQNVLTAAEKLLHPKPGSESPGKTEEKMIQEGKHMNAFIKNMLRFKKGFKSTTEGPMATDHPVMQTMSTGSWTATTSKIVTKEKTTQESQTQRATTLPDPISVSKSTMSTQAMPTTRSISESTISGQTTPATNPQSSPRGVTSKSFTPRSTTSLTHSTEGHSITSRLSTILPATSYTNQATSLSLVQSSPSGKVTPVLLPNSTPVDFQHGRASLPNHMTLSNALDVSTPGPSSTRSASFPVETHLPTKSRNSGNLTLAVLSTSFPSESRSTSPQDLFPEPDYNITQSHLQSAQSQTTPSVPLSDPSHNASVSPSSITMLANTSPDSPSQTSSSPSHSESFPHTMQSNTSPQMPSPPSSSQTLPATLHTNISSNTASKSHMHPLVPTPTTLHDTLSPTSPHDITDSSPLTNQATETTQSSTSLIQEDLTSTHSPQPDVSTSPMSKTSSSKLTPSVPSSNSTNGLVQLPTLDEIRRTNNQTKVHNDTAASVDDSKNGQEEVKKSIIASNGALIAAVCFGVIFLLAVLVILSKHWYQAYQRRHYSKVDYLINGMYN